ncbi:MAG: ParB/RepB/Spo0J family partition protein [Candidatus Promineifilaceae bacterium]
MSKKRGLGRGLGSLIPGSDQETQGESGGLATVPVSAISPNPHQPRTFMDPNKLAELADSIREHGLIQPLIVRQEDSGYILIAGERRWRAAQLAGLPTVPVVIKEASPQAMLEIALIENIQRADLNPIEEAMAYQQLIDEFGLTQEAVAKRVGKSRPTVANIVRLLNLPDIIQEAVNNESISGAHARALLPLPTPESQIAVMNSIIKNGWSVRHVEATVAKIRAEEAPKPKKTPRLSAEMAALESEFRHRLGTQVKIQPGDNGGRVVIHYYSDEELQAIYEALVGDES